MENSKSLLEMALKLKPQDRFLLIEGLIRSLDEPNKDLMKSGRKKPPNVYRLIEREEQRGYPIIRSSRNSLI